MSAEDAAYLKFRRGEISETEYDMIRSFKEAAESLPKLTLNEADRAEKERDEIDHPAHYNASGIEPIDVIEEWNLGFHLGNAVKYIARMGKKPGQSELKDLKKAHWYLGRMIKHLEKREK